MPEGLETAGEQKGWSSPDRFGANQGARTPRPRPMGRANRLAVFALFCAFTVPVLGIVFGVVAQDEIRVSEGKERGLGMAQWAIGLGIAVIAVYVGVGIWLGIRLSQ